MNIARREKWLSENPQINPEQFAIVATGFCRYNKTNDGIFYWSRAVLPKCTKCGFNTVHEARAFAIAKKIKSAYDSDSQQSVKFIKIDDIMNAQDRPGQLMGIANIDAFTFV